MAATRKRAGFAATAARLRPAALLTLIAHKGERMQTQADRLSAAQRRRLERHADRAANLSNRLAPALLRLIADAARKTAEGRTALAQLDARLQTAPAQRYDRLRQRLDALDRIRSTLGYAETLKRGYAVVRGDGNVVTSKAAAEAAVSLEIEFADGRLGYAKPVVKRSKSEGPDQGSLF